MSTIKTQTTKDYGTDALWGNRYLNAKQEYDQRVGEARHQAANWRIATFLVTIALIICIGGLIYQSGKSKVIPYVIQINDKGAVVSATAVPEKYIPRAAEIKYFLREFVIQTQSLPLDPVIAKQNWIKAYSVLTPAAITKINNLIKTKGENPLSKIGQETKQIEITVVVPLSESSYQVRWKTKIYDNNGNLIETNKMTGLFTIEFREPTEKTIKNNPIGLYIKDFNWEKEN